MRPAIFFDDGLGQLSPLTDLRPAFHIRTGAYETHERLRGALELYPVGFILPRQMLDFKARLATDGFTLAPTGIPGSDLIIHQPLSEAVLFINSRCPLPYAPIAALTPGQCLVEERTGDIIAAVMRQDAVMTWTPAEPTRGLEVVGTLPAPALLSRPWHVRTFRDRCLAVDLELIAAAGEFDPAPGHTVVVGAASRAKVHATARVYPTVVLDIENGPIVIDEHAVVRPGAVITGPAYIGAHSTVLDRAVIRGNTVIGPHCKVAGEVSGTIFQGYANKAHDGFLGDSYVGEWANLGAGTTNSNLLNTYSEVLARVSAASSVERTGETFLGCIIGDHAKFAICTRIMTGSVVHTGAMWAASAPVSGCVGAFAWVTDAGAKRYRFEKFAEVARAVMGRRKVVPSEAYVERLRELHAASQ